MKIRDKEGEASSFANLGVLFLYLNKDDIEEEYLEKVLLISKEIGTPGGEFRFRCNMTAVILYQWEDSGIIGMRAL